MTLPRDRPRAQSEEIDVECDNDVGRPCHELWPTDAASWCDGCRNRCLADLEAARAQITALEQQKDGAYHERDQVVAALSKCFPAWLSRHEGGEWDDDWRNIVFLGLPTGQASWHIHDSELPLFAHLQRGAETWDGHTTEEKYRRLATLPEQSAQITALAQEKARRGQEPAICVHCGNGLGVNLHNELAFTICDACWVADRDQFAAQLQRAESAEAQVAALTVQLEEAKESNQLDQSFHELMLDSESAEGHLLTVEQSHDWADVEELRDWYMRDVKALLALRAALTVERERLTKENEELAKNAFTRVDRQGVVSDDSVPQGKDGCSDV